MKDLKTINDIIKWTPPHQRNSRFGGVVSTEIEPRKPLLWVVRDGDEIFLVNETNETLDFVFSNTGGFATWDDIVENVSNRELYKYQDVKNGSAVKVEEFDGFYDLDYIIDVSVSIKSRSLGNQTFTIRGGKGGKDIRHQQVVLWNTGENGKHVVNRTYTR